MYIYNGIHVVVFIWQMYMYDMSKARKGQACIISIPEFEGGTDLARLDGYNVDKSKLSEMWHAMGFDVKYPVTKKHLLSHC